MKLGLVRRGYSDTGGAEAYLLRLAVALSTRGHDLVLFSDTEWPDRVLDQPGMKMAQAVLQKSDPLEFADRMRGLPRKHGCEMVLSMERIWECDVFRAGDGVHAAWLARRAHYEPRWRSWLRGWDPKHRGLLALERALFEGAARRIIANSSLVKSEIVAHYGTPEQYIHVVPNGLPPLVIPEEARASMRADLGFGMSDYVVLFVGSGWERKGLRFAVDAVREVPNAVLLVVGKGRAWSAECVRFLGPRDDVPHLLAAADAFVLPTIYDPFSNASLEALAAGLPVITTRANGCAEILDPGVDGTVVAEPGDIKTLAAALLVWADADLRAKTREARLAKAAQYTIERNVRETLEVLERA